MHIIKCKKSPKLTLYVIKFFYKPRSWPVQLLSFSNIEYKNSIQILQILLFPLQMKKNCMFTFMLILKTYIQKPLSLLKSERPVILYCSTKDYKEVSDIKVKATSNTRRLIANISFTLLEQLTVLKKQIATSSYDLLMI